jgi:hypothetical protein
LVACVDGHVCVLGVICPAVVLEGRRITASHSKAGEELLAWQGADVSTGVVILQQQPAQRCFCYASLEDMKADRFGAEGRHAACVSVVRGAVYKH